jgi:hypothetical protein
LRSATALRSAFLAFFFFAAVRAALAATCLVTTWPETFVKRFAVSIQLAALAGAGAVAATIEAKTTVETANRARRAANMDFHKLLNIKRSPLI